jgi:hypothetical protein
MDWEEHCDGCEEPYRRVDADLRHKFLVREGGQQAVDFADLLENADDSHAFETAIKHAGFVMGFEYCRRLLTGGAR